MASPTFTLLPTELRQRIYKLSLSHPRIIHIRTPDYPSNISYLPLPYPSLSTLNLTYSDISWTSRTSPPSLLSVCIESRAVALAYYTLRFALLPAGSEVIYINPKVDMTFVHVEKWPHMLKILLKDVRVFDVVDKGIGIRRLVLSTNVWTSLFSADPKYVRGKDVQTLAGLKEVIIVDRKTVMEDDAADTYEAERDGGFLVAPERDDKVALWEEDVLSRWKNLKQAGLEDGVKLRLLRWRQDVTSYRLST